MLSLLNASHIMQKKRLTITICLAALGLAGKILYDLFIEDLKSDVSKGWVKITLAELHSWLLQPLEVNNLKWFGLAIIAAIGVCALTYLLCIEIKNHSSALVGYEKLQAQASERKIEIAQRDLVIARLKEDLHAYSKELKELKAVLQQRTGGVTNDEVLVLKLMAEFRNKNDHSVTEREFSALKKKGLSNLRIENALKQLQKKKYISISYPNQYHLGGYYFTDEGLAVAAIYESH
ncbi:hypothetical protein [Chromobacterium vaccinii]|uniref:hypothetical protein n=1 Tax=Chromobacterium vaccinii TaxID=1108595 RepID=UPI0031DB4916